MENKAYIMNSLHSQGLPIYETDIPYIQSILFTMKQAQTSLQAFPNINLEVPITVVDKGMIIK